MQMQTYKEIDKDMLERIKGNAWSIESRNEDEEGGRDKEYMGSQITGHMVFDYYKDPAGSYWYGTRAQLLTGEIVSMEVYIFGHELRRKKRG